jgi:hypothetical protein
VSGIIQFFAVQYKGFEIDWVRCRLMLALGIKFHLGDSRLTISVILQIGNTTPFAGCDGEGCPLLTLAEGETFGPAVGQFS